MAHRLRRFLLILLATVAALVAVTLPRPKHPDPPSPQQDWQALPASAPIAQAAATVSIPRMKPGDPVLSINAPRGTVAVIADFPFGKRQLCGYDRDREKWACRFLVPRAVKDGRYAIRITCIGGDGARTPMEAEYVVDSKAPVLEITARRVGAEVELTARPKSFVLELKSGPAGAVSVVHDLKRLRARTTGGQLVAFNLENRPGEFVWKTLVKARGSVSVEAIDFAGNIATQQVALP